MNTKHKLVIVEDNKEYITTLTEIINLEDDIEVVALYNDGEAALDTLKTDQPDIVLIDLNLPKLSGIELLGHLSAQSNSIKLLVLTAYSDSEKVFEALSNGATGYVVKSMSVDEIILALREALQGGAPMSPEIARMVVKSFWKNQKSPLSEKETKILALLAEGKTYDGVANELFNSKETIKWHIKNIYIKLGVDNKSKAIEAGKTNKYI